MENAAQRRIEELELQAGADWAMLQDYSIAIKKLKNQLVEIVSGDDLKIDDGQTILTIETCADNVLVNLHDKVSGKTFVCILKPSDALRVGTYLIP